MAESDIEDIEFEQPHLIRVKLGEQAFRGLQYIQSHYKTGADQGKLSSGEFYTVTPSYERWVEVHKVSAGAFNEQDREELLQGLATLYRMPEGWAERQKIRLSSAKSRS